MRGHTLPGLGTILLCWLIGTSASVGRCAASAVSVAVELGITPESMVIAGFQPSSASMVLSSIEAAGAVSQALATQHQVVDTAAAQVTQLVEALFDSGDDEQLLAQHEAALQQLAAAREQDSQLRSDLFAIATEGLPPQEIQRLIIWRSGAAHRVPPEFRVAERSPEQWRAIKLALRAERRAIRLGEEVAEDHAQLLAEVRSDAALAEAAINLTANLELMQLAFDQFPA